MSNLSPATSQSTARRGGTRQPCRLLESPRRLETSLGPKGGVRRLREQPVRFRSCVSTGLRDAETLLGHGEGWCMEGKPMQLPLKELFWGRQGTHPLRPSEPCHSTLRCAADVQPDPTSRFPPRNHSRTSFGELAHRNSRQHSPPAQSAAFGLNGSPFRDRSRDPPEEAYTAPHLYCTDGETGQRRPL